MAKKTEEELKKEREDEVKKIMNCTHPIHGGSFALSGNMKKKDLIEIQFLEGKKHLPGRYRAKQKVFVSTSLANQWCDVSKIAVRTGDKVSAPEVVRKDGANT